MTLINIEELLKEANKYLKDPDIVIDPYDMSFVWASEKLKKLHGGNFENDPIFMHTEDPEHKTDFRKMHPEVAKVDHTVRERKVIVKGGDGKKREILINFVVIKFNDQPYLISKTMGMKELA